jgi:DNA-binding transcriptional LysR family regulator
LAGREEISLVELQDETFVCYEEGSGIHAALTKACEDEGFEPRISFECGTLRSLTAAGPGMAVVPRLLPSYPGRRWRWSS